MASEWMCKGRVLSLERPLVMAILNATPESFSDGGSYSSPEVAADAALRMIDDGADIIDIGGESSRPGSAYVSADEEMARVLPVVKAIRKRSNVPLSIDTRKADVARASLAEGADIINDISAFRDDPGMVSVARTTGAGVVLMHMRGVPSTMQSKTTYGDVVADVAGWLKERVDAVVAEGVDRKTIAIDPGIGFAKTTEQNIALLSRMRELAELDAPLLIGLSRKRFIGEITKVDVPRDRLSGSLTGMLWSIWHGANILRVHDVKESRQAVDLAFAIASSSH